MSGSSYSESANDLSGRPLLRYPAIAVAGVLCLAAVTGCTSGSAHQHLPAAAPSPRPTLGAPAAQATVESSPTISPSPAGRTRFKEAYLNAFEDFLAAYSSADFHGQSNSAELSRTASAQALAWARSNVTEHVKLGVMHSGVAHFRHVGQADVTPTFARVGQCMDWSSWPVVNRLTGVTFQTFAPWSQLVYATVQRSAAGWLVTTVQVTAAAC